MIIHGDVIPVAEEEIERYEALVKRMVANLAVHPGRFVGHWMLIDVACHWIPSKR